MAATGKAVFTSAETYGVESLRVVGANMLSYLLDTHSDIIIQDDCATTSESQSPRTTDSGLW